MTQKSSFSKYTNMHHNSLLSIPLDSKTQLRDPPVVPKPSQRDDISFSPNAIPTLPVDLINLAKTNVTLPVVKERGVKETIRELGDIFNLKNYKNNLVHFWFLDFITDCLWRMQDEYSLPNDMQRIVISWMIFFIDLIRDTNKNFNLEEIFDILRETISIAGECLNEGDPWLSDPNDLVSFMTMEDMYAINLTEERLFETNKSKEEIEYIDLRINPNTRHIFILKEPSECSSSDLSYKESRSISVCTCPTESENQSLISDSKIKITGNTSNVKRLLYDYKKLNPIKSSASLDSEGKENAQIAKISSRALLAILDIIFEYFGNEFQYYLVHTILTNPPDYITETIKLYNVPKKTTNEPLRERILSHVLDVDSSVEEVKGLSYEEKVEYYAKKDGAKYKKALETTCERYKNFIYPLSSCATPEYFMELFHLTSEEFLSFAPKKK